MRLPWWVPGGLAVLGRPRLWRTALWQAAALAGPGWWRRFPPFPRPAGEWLAFRMETAYGDPAARPSSRELVAFLEWCRDHRSPRPVK